MPPPALLMDSPRVDGHRAPGLAVVGADEGARLVGDAAELKGEHARAVRGVATNLEDKIF